MSHIFHRPANNGSLYTVICIMAVLFISLLVLIIILYAIPTYIRSHRITRRLAIDIKNQSQDLELQAAFALESPHFRNSIDDGLCFDSCCENRNSPSLMSLSSATEKYTGEMRDSESMEFSEGMQLPESPRTVELRDTSMDSLPWVEMPKGAVDARECLMGP